MFMEGVARVCSTCVSTDGSVRDYMDNHMTRGYWHDEGSTFERVGTADALGSLRGDTPRIPGVPSELAAVGSDDGEALGEAEGVADALVPQVIQRGVKQLSQALPPPPPEGEGDVEMGDDGGDMSVDEEDDGEEMVGGTLHQVIIDPVSGVRHNIGSIRGSQILKNYLSEYN